MGSLKIRPARESDAKSTVDLALRAFDEFIAPEYPAEGVAHFYANVTTDGLVAAITDQEITLLATVDDTLAGVVQVRNETHITWLYVDKAYQRRGVGRKLLVSAVEEIRRRTPHATMITLNSSPYAVPIYRSIGFEATGPEQTKDGMRMTPMQANISILFP